MSKIEVDTIDTQSSTTLQVGSTNTALIKIGTSGDTVEYPAGTTFTQSGTQNVTSGGVINVKSGGNITIDSGATITNNGTATGFSADLTNLNATNLTSGTVPDARFPATLPAANGSALTNLNATALTSGTLPDARFPATLPAISGANLTNLPSGSMTPAFSVRLSGNQTIADSVTTKIQFNTEILDSDSAFNTTNYEFTVPSGKAGKYFIHLRNYIYGSGNAAMFSLNLDVKHTPSGGSQTNLIPMKYYEQSGSIEVGRSGSCSGIVDLGVGDIIAGYLSVSTNGLSPTCESSGTMFCGFKILE